MWAYFYSSLQCNSSKSAKPQTRDKIQFGRLKLLNDTSRQSHSIILINKSKFTQLDAVPLKNQRIFPFAFCSYERERDHFTWKPLNICSLKDVETRNSKFFIYFELHKCFKQILFVLQTFHSHLQRERKRWRVRPPSVSTHIYTYQPDWVGKGKWEWIDGSVKIDVLDAITFSFCANDNREEKNTRWWKRKAEEVATKLHQSRRQSFYEKHVEKFSYRWNYFNASSLTHKHVNVRNERYPIGKP